jgi:hypothetical protein
MKKVKVDELTIEGVVYIPKESVKSPHINTEGMPYVLIRTYSAGVHAGYMKHREGKEVSLIKGRRIWKWKGAAACSQLAKEGIREENYNNSKIELPSNYVITEAIEIHEMNIDSSLTIKNAPEWKE